MQIFNFPLKVKRIVLALGAESAGNFSVFHNGKIYFSENFGDLSEEKNFKNFKKNVTDFLKKGQFEPNIIISDLHPLLKTTLWADKLSKKYKAKRIQVQHHHAHIFTSIGDKILDDYSYQIPRMAYGIAMDGTGYGLDDKIWGGEVFKISNQFQNLNDKKPRHKFHIERIGSLENQIMLGGELSVREPARMLIPILSNFLSKKEIYAFVKKYYAKNEFEVLYAQWEQNFNCQETSSTGRILDSVSLLLGFCENKRNYKHEAIDLLELNSTKPYRNIKPQIEIVKSSLISNNQHSMLNEFSMTKFSKKYYILNTTFLFEYLIKNIKKDKQKLATTAQEYISQGLLKIVKFNTSENKPDIFISGGIGKNKIISNYLASQRAYLNKKISPGDEGLSFGQIIYYLYI